MRTMVRGSVVLVKYLKLIFEYVFCSTIEVRSLWYPFRDPLW